MNKQILLLRNIEVFFIPEDIEKEILKKIGSEQYNNIYLKFLSLLENEGCSLKWKEYNDSWVGEIKYLNNIIGHVSLWEFYDRNIFYVFVYLKAGNHDTPNSVNELSNNLTPKYGAINISLDSNDFAYLKAAILSKTHEPGLSDCLCNWPNCGRNTEGADMAKREKREKDQ